MLSSLMNYVSELLFRANALDVLKHTVDDLNIDEAKIKVLVHLVDLFCLRHLNSLYLCLLNVFQVSLFWSHLSLLE